MESIIHTLYREIGKPALAPSVELDTVWQLLGELEQRVPRERVTAEDIREWMLSAVKRAEEDGFNIGFRCAAALTQECF